MKKNLSIKDVKSIATVGSEDDVVNLLKTYGDKKGYDLHAYKERYIDHISLGIDCDGDAERRAKKTSLILSYQTGQGIFKKKFGIFNSKAAPPAAEQPVPEAPAEVAPPAAPQEEQPSTRDIVKELRASIRASTEAKRVAVPRR